MKKRKANIYSYLNPHKKNENNNKNENKHAKKNVKNEIKKGNEKT
jgi:hypothetical protein